LPAAIVTLSFGLDIFTLSLFLLRTIISLSRQTPTGGYRNIKGFDFDDKDGLFDLFGCLATDND